MTTFVDFVSLYLAKHIVWRRTRGAFGGDGGIWLGPEASHDPKVLLNTIAKTAECWCGSGDMYESCHRREDVARSRPRTVARYFKTDPEESMSRKHNVHVSPKGGDRKGWKVTQDGEVQSTHRTQRAAIDAGRREAKRDGVDLVTHNQQGIIRSKDSFGPDPNPPRDTEH